MEPFYSINDEKNTALYEKYKGLADKERDVLFGGVWQNTNIMIWLLLSKK